MNTCYVLEAFKSDRGEIAIIDFPPGKRPKLKMVLTNKFNQNLKWEIIAISMPTLTGINHIQVKRKYDGHLLWGCVLSKFNHETFLKKEDALEFDE